MSNPVDRLDLIIATEDARWQQALTDVNQICDLAAHKAFAAAWDGPFASQLQTGRQIEAAIILSNDEDVQRFNCDFRGQDKPTNVLSFASLDDADTFVSPGDFAGGSPDIQSDIPVMLGDIIIAYETTAGEALSEQKSLADHLSHLVVHGMAHLLGYDHQVDEEAEIMEALETEILHTLGIANPYNAETKRNAD